MNNKKTMRAVVVDDDFAIAKGFADELTRLGFAATPFHHWEAAKHALTSGGKTDLFVIDNALGEAFSGIQLARQLAEAGHLAGAKVLVVTGFAESLEAADKETASKWKFNLCSKPVDLSREAKKLLPDAVLVATGKPVEQVAAWRSFLHWFSTREGMGVAALLAILIGLGAWWFPRSNDASTATTRPGGSNNPASGQPLVPIKVRVAVNPVPLGALPIIAEKGGHWKTAGLEVDLISFPTGKASLDAVLGGGAEFATAAETPIMRAGLAGFTPAVLATIASSPDDCKVCYRPDHGITKPSDLKGKKVATAFGTSAEYFMDTFLRHHGIRRDEVTALNMKPAEMVNTLARGDISAFFIWEPYPLEAGKILKANTGIFLGGGIYTETFQIVTRRDYAQGNAEACQRLLRALLAAEQHAATNEQDAAEKVASFTQLAPADVSAIWKNFQFRVGLNADFVALLESQASWARASDPTLPTNVSFRALIWPEPLSKVSSNRVNLKP